MTKRILDCGNCGFKIVYSGNLRMWPDDDDTCTCPLDDENPVTVIDRLAEIGARERAQAAYERGLRDGQRLRRGDVSADEVSAEIQADPP